MKNSTQNIWLDVTNLILGLGFFCAAFVCVESPSAAWSGVIVGCVVAACSIITLQRYSIWAELANLLAGLW